MQNTVHKKSAERKTLSTWDLEAGSNSYRKSPSVNRVQTKSLKVIETTKRAGYQDSGRMGYQDTGRTRYKDSERTRYQSSNMEYINQRRRARRRRAYFYRALAFVMLISCVMLISLAVGAVFRFVSKEDGQEAVPATSRQISEYINEDKIEKPEITVDLLEVNDYSRPATELDGIKSIFVHYTANPGTSAKQNRSYFSNLSETHERSASAHFIIGYEGEIIQCIPLDEQAYAVMTRNNDSISIECCYLDEDGEFTQETYDSLIHLLAWLKQEYNLENEDILRHYDCGGKLCPLYYVENEDMWERLLRDVSNYQD